MRTLKGLKYLYDNVFLKKEAFGNLDLHTFLKEVPLFKTLNRREIKEIAQILHERVYEENEFVFELGHPASAVYFVKKGCLAVEVSTSRGTIQLAELRAGDFVGEIALLENNPRSASVRALERTEILSLFRKDLNKLILTHPEITSSIYKSLAQIIAQRLMATNKVLKNQSSEDGIENVKTSA